MVVKVGRQGWTSRLVVESDRLGCLSRLVLKIVVKVVVKIVVKIVVIALLFDIFLNKSCGSRG